MQQPPYQPRTGLASGAPQQPTSFEHQKPVDLFDPNFLNQAGQPPPRSQFEQYSKDVNVVDSIFGAQNTSNISGGPSSQNVDTSHMSERDRRIFMRDQERKNRMQGGNSGSSAVAYGVAEPPPPQPTTGANIFGEQQPVAAANSRDQAWQNKLAQRNLPPPTSQQPPLSFPSQGQGQGGFTPANQVNQQLVQLGQMPGMGMPPPQPSAHMPSPNTAHRKFKAIGQSPLRNSNLLTSAAAQQSPMRNSLTAQKLQQAKDLDTSIQGGYEQQMHMMNQQNNPYQQVNISSQRSGPGRLPPSGASPSIRSNKQAGILDQLGNNEIDLKRRQDNRNFQQEEYNKYLSTQQAQLPPAHMRQRSADRRQVPDVNSSLHNGGMQMIGGHQARLQEDKLKMQQEYQQQLNNQMQSKQNQRQDAIQLSEARKKQISDQVFNELLQQEPTSVRSHMEVNLHQQMVGQQFQPTQVPNLPYINQPMQQSNIGGGRPGLPPRVQSAVGANRKDEVRRMQGQTEAEDPWYRSRANEHSAKRAQAEKKKEYAAMLQEQMAMKKKQSQSQQQQQLPLPDQLFDQRGPPQQQYPVGQIVNFSQPSGMPPPQGLPQSYQPLEAPLQRSYSMNQQVNFDRPSMPVAASYQQPMSGLMGPAPGGGFGGPPPPGQQQFMPPQQQHLAYDQQLPQYQSQQQPNTERSRSPNSRFAGDPGRIHPNDQTNPNGGGANAAQQQRSKQEEYRRELEAQMKQNEDKKRKIKEDQARYEMKNDKDMAQYMGINAPGGNQQQPPTTQQPPVLSTGQFGAPDPNLPPAYGGGLMMPQMNNDPIAPSPLQQQAQGGANNGQPSGVRLGSDITKRQEETDPAKLSAKLQYQLEIKQQMEEQKARKEAEKQKLKREDEEHERRIQGEQEKLNQQEFDEIKKEGKRDAPELKQRVKKVDNSQFQTSDQAANRPPPSNNGFQEPQPSSNMNDPPTVSKVGEFTKPEPIAYQPLQLNTADNFTLHGPPSSQFEPPKNDLFGAQPPTSLLSPANGAFGGLPPPGGFGGPPPPGGGLQSPFGGPQSQNNTQYSQFGGQQNFVPPSSAPLSNQQMSTQSDWAVAQQSQSNKMFDDQQKMIGMYQQALEQILQYRNQYFEQAMQMREKIMQEREQIFDFKQQQMAEVKQIQAVKTQLGSMMDMADQQTVLNPQVANNLNQYITKQKEQILMMSQSSANMSKIIRDANQMQQQNQQQQPPLQQQQQYQQTPMGGDRELPVTSQRVEIPRQSTQDMPQITNPMQINFSPPPEDGFIDLQKQVDDVAAQIAANDIDQQNRSLNTMQEQRLSGQYPLQQENNLIQQEPQYSEFQRNPQFEQSLSSESKMVKVPNNNLQAMAAQVVQRSQESASKPLLETWNQESAEKYIDRDGVISPTRAVSVTPTPLQMATPKRLGGNLIVNPRSPLHSSSVVPQTIQEMPQEEDKPRNNVDGMRASGFDFQTADNAKKSEYDFNNRAMSVNSSPPRQNQMVSLDAREEIAKIENQIVQQQTQSAWADRRATMTGTSFYDHHRQTQKIQEQTQQEEMQKQLMRILGSTENQGISSSKDDPLKEMQQAYGPDTDRENNENATDQKSQLTPHSSTVKVRKSQDNMLKGVFGQTQNEYDQELHRQAQAKAVNPLVDPPSSNTNQTASEINIAATDQSDNLRKMQAYAQAHGAEANMGTIHSISDGEPMRQSKNTFQPDELQEQSRYTENPQHSTERKQWGQQKQEPDQLPDEQKQEAVDESLWDDPDLVPVPVLPAFSDNSLTYEVQENGENTMNAQQLRQMPPSAHEYKPYMQGHSISQADDRTVLGLQGMDPQLIATDEFVVEQFHDEITGEEKVQLSSKNQQNQQQYDQVHPRQQFQTYKQSEPMLQDDDASRKPPTSVAQPTFADQQSLSIPTQIDVNNNGDDDGMVSARSKKMQEMAEIEELIRKVTNTANVTDQKEKELALKRQFQSNGTQSSWQKKNLGTPVAPSTGKHNLIGEEPSEAPKMATAAPNVAPHRLGQMQRAAEEMQPKPTVNNDQQILSDLDKIIANLEMQQKNMATFGVPQPLDEDPEGEDKSSEQQPSLQFNENNVERTEEEELDGDKTGRSQWTSLSNARKDRAQANQTTQEQAAGNYRPVSGKAPLDPKSSRPKSGMSRGTSAKRGKGGIDASPQRVGKYAMMALQQQEEQKSATKSNKGSVNGSRIDASPQRVGKYAMMALQQQTGANASPSPQRLGKFAQMALQKTNQPVIGEQVDDISNKYARNPSRERLEERSMISQANESRVQNTSLIQQQIAAQASGPILRPVSGKSNNSRYTAASAAQIGAKRAGRPPSNMVQTVQVDQESVGFRQTTRTAGQMTQGTVVKDAGGNAIAYYSDDEEDSRTAIGRNDAQAAMQSSAKQGGGISDSGRTQMTLGNAQTRFNIADDQDEINH